MVLYFGLGIAQGFSEAQISCSKNLFWQYGLSLSHQARAIWGTQVAICWQVPLTCLWSLEFVSVASLPHTRSTTTPFSTGHEATAMRSYLIWKEKNKGVFLFCLVLYSRTQNWWKCRAGRRIFGTRSLRGFFPQRHSYAFLEVFAHNIFQPGTHVDTLHWIWKAERFPLPGCHDGPRDYLLLLFCGRTVGRAVTLCSWKGRKFGLYCIPASRNEHWKMDSWLLN